MIYFCLFLVSGLDNYNNTEEDDEGTFVDEDDISFSSTGSDDVVSVTSDLSRLSFGNETCNSARSARTMKTNCTGFKSILYTNKQRTGTVSSSQKRTIYGSKTLGLPFIIEYWSNKDSRMCCSVQLLCLGVINPKKFHVFRVSTDRRFLVVRVTMSENALNVEKALYKVFESLPQPQRDILEYHTKVAARKVSISKLIGRDSTKDVILEQRIPLPFECEHIFATKESDPFFHGVKFVPYPNGEIWAHIELLKNIKDGYVGRDMQSAYLDSIVEDMDDFEAMVQENEALDFADDEKSTISMQSRTSQQSYATPSMIQRKATPSTQSQQVTPKSSMRSVATLPLPKAPYPPMVVGNTPSGKSFCSNVCVPGERKGKFSEVVARLPFDKENALVCMSDSNSVQYDGKIHRGNVKRRPKDQD